MKIKGAIILAATAGAVAATPARAQTQPGFEIGVEAFDYSYRELFEGDTIVTDDGVLYGVHASYVHAIGGDLFLRARAIFATGSVDYSSADGDILGVKRDTGQLDLQVGYDLRLSPGATLTAFTGVGARVLNDHSGGEQTQSGLLGYDREIGYAYVPLGVALGVQLGGGMSAAFSGQYNHVFGGTATSRFSQLDPDLPDLDLDLNGGSGFEVSAIVSIPVGGSAIRVGPFLRSWNIDPSESLIIVEDGDELEVFEPQNKTREAGFRLSFAF